jgi:regulatory protein
MLIYSITKTSEDVFKLNTSLGSFFLRTSYLEENINFQQESLFDFENLKPNTQVSFEISENIIEASLLFSVERTAVAYLERAEHSTEMLRRKLKTKGYSPNAIEKVLTFAKKRNWLSDERYAGAFLRNRSIRKAEGRTRLLAELASRGINRETAEKALDDFFQQKNETDILARAASKLKKQRKTKEKAFQALIRLGFSWNDIKSYINDNW